MQLCNFFLSGPIPNLQRIGRKPDGRVHHPAGRAAEFRQKLRGPRGVGLREEGHRGDEGCVGGGGDDGMMTGARRNLTSQENHFGGFY